MPTPTFVPIGTWDLPSGRRIVVTAVLTVDFSLANPDLDHDDRQSFYDDIFPAATRILRQKLSVMQFHPGNGWEP